MASSREYVTHVMLCTWPSAVILAALVLETIVIRAEESLSHAIIHSHHRARLELSMSQISRGRAPPKRVECCAGMPCIYLVALLHWCADVKKEKRGI